MKLTSGSRFRVTAIAIAIAGSAITIAATAPGGNAVELPCRVLPNGVVPFVVSWDAGCPLNRYDRIVAVDVSGHAVSSDPAISIGEQLRMGVTEVVLLVLRDNDGRWMTVRTIPETATRRIGRLATAVLISAMLLGVALITLWGSSAPSAFPFTLFYTSVSVLFVSSLCGDQSSVLPFFGVGASCLAPAALAHIALTFPRKRDALVESTVLPSSLYAMAALLGVIGLANFHRSPAVWVLTDRVAIALTLAAWLLLVFKCILAVLESDSRIDRARARVLLAGVICVPAAPLSLSIFLGDNLPGGSLSALMISVALIPLPIGYAIAGYRLFDLELTMRRAVAYMLFVAASALGSSVVAMAVASSLGLPVPLGDPALLFAVALVGFLIGEPLRLRLWGAIDGWISPWFRRLRQLAETHARNVAALRDPDDVARTLCECVSETLEASGVSVFLESEGSWRLSHAAGTRSSMCLEPWLVRAAAVHGDMFSLDEEDVRIEPPEFLRERSADVDLVVSLRSGADVVAMMLIGPSLKKLPYSVFHLDFVKSIARHSAVAIQNGNLSRELLAAERFATLGRIEAGLLHDLGKPLGVMERLASRLPSQTVDPERLRRDSLAISRLAAEVRSTIRDMLSTRRETWNPGFRSGISIEEGIHEAVEMTARVHGPNRVSVRVPPGFSGSATLGRRFVRILTNVLDNALLATEGDHVATLNVLEEPGELTIEVSDSGVGMDATTTERAFEPFFTTRGSGEGTGLGLFICRDLVEDLGGTIRLSSKEGAGTRVTIRIPLGDDREGRSDVA